MAILQRPALPALALAAALVVPLADVAAQSPTAVPSEPRGASTAAAASPAPAASEAPAAPPSVDLLAPGADDRRPLEGTSWRLVSYRRRGDAREPTPRVVAWLTMRGGRLSGSSGCSSLAGRYGLMGEAIDVTLQAPRVGCSGSANAVQRAMRAALLRAASAQVVAEAGADQLVIRDAQGREDLRFEPDDVGALEGTEWRLGAYVTGGQRVAADATQPAVLTFRPKQRSDAQRTSAGSLVGSTGCNGIVGRYTRAGDALAVPRLQVAEAPCSEALAAQQAVMLGVLQGDAVVLDLPADRLVLTDSSSGDSLDLVSTTPLEGTTWQLSRLPGAGVRGGPVTLRLEGSALSGEGPCGAYSGAYATDGLFLTVRELRAGEAEACRRKGLEARLLAALRRAVLVERERNGIALLDATGRVVARFRAAGLP
jgi:heat shock protein HslJ